MSQKSGENERDRIRWIEDRRRRSSSDMDHSVSEDSEDNGVEQEGPSRTVRSNSIFQHWQPELIWADLQRLPGFETEFVAALQKDNLSEVLQNPFALTTGLIVATYLGNATMVKGLLNNGASISQMDPEGRTALHIAANCDQVECLRVLVGQGADVNQMDASGSVTALCVAASKGSLPSVEFLLLSGADPTLGKKTALHYAVENLHVECVRELLRHGAPPNTIQVFSETPLHVAATFGSAEIIRLLLQHGASVNVQCGPDKSTPLHLAAEDGNVECVRLLVDAGAQISAVNYKRQTALHIAALCQAVEIVELLLATAAADPNAPDGDGRTPLHAAIVKVSRSPECVRLLLTAGAHVNRPDAFGYTPLHLAALHEFSACVLLLIDAGGDVTVRTNGGVSALTFITRRTPDVVPKFLNRLDAAVHLNDHEIGDVDCELRLDFDILVPPLAGVHGMHGEMELLLAFVEVGHREVLKHPLCETFLHLKWRRIRKYFVFSLVCHAIYALLFSAFTVGVFLSASAVPIWTEAIRHVLIVLNALMVSKEVFQLAHNWITYVRHWDNWLQWLVIGSGLICALPTTITTATWQHHVAAVGIFLTWLELMMIVGRFPVFGLYIQMFATVAVNFVRFLLAYVCLLVAFGLSFGVLFAGHPPFQSILPAIIKTVVMMSGELEYEDIFYTSGQPVALAGTAHLMFLAFVVLVTVILANLMVGLAVSDIQGLQASAGLDRLVRQAELVAHLESMLFSRCLPSSSLLTFFRRHALLLQSRRHCALHLRPNDPRENRIPRDLIRNVYALVVQRKERGYRKRSRKERSWSRINSFVSTYTYMGRSNKLNVEYNNFKSAP